MNIKYQFDQLITFAHLNHLDHNPLLIKIAQHIRNFTYSIGYPQIKVTRPSYVLILLIIALIILTITKILVQLTLILYLIGYQGYLTMKSIHTHQNGTILLQCWIATAMLLILNNPITIILDILPFYPYTKFALYGLIWFNGGQFIQWIVHENLPNIPIKTYRQVNRQYSKPNKEFTDEAYQEYEALLFNQH